MFGSLSSIGTVHLVFALVAMSAGLMVVLMQKGTRLHRTLGHIYVTSMLGVNVTALCIYRLFGHFGVFHVLAFVSLIGVISGVAHAVTRRPRDTWLKHHRSAILWSYTGLLAAFTAEVAVRVVRTKFWYMVIIPSLLVTFVAWILIEKDADAKLKRAMRGKKPDTEKRALEGISEI